MRRTHRPVLAAAVLVLLLPLSAAGAAPQPPSQGASATVEMGSNYYAPREVRVDVGGTVTWRAAGGQHDVRADDGSFFLWPDQKSSSGETRSQTFTEEGIVRYYCTLHGGPGGFGMSGIVYVGDVELESPPELHVPTEEHPTLRAALRDARQGSTIHLAPGVHRAGQRITQPGVTIVGTGDDPSAVVLRAATSAGVRVEADNVRLANLTIASGSRSGVLAEGVDRLRLDDVHVVTDEVGVRFDGGRGLTIHGGAVEGHRRAGVLVTGCDPCDARIEGLRAEDNLVGIDVVDAAGVFLRSNLLRGNGGGVRAADTPADPVAGPRTLVVIGNRFVDNDETGSGPPADPELPVASGTAIGLAGVRQAEVLGNEVEGSHRYGVALTALAGPTLDVAVRDNLVGGAAEADLAWDGLGAQVCFAGNRTAGRDDPTSQPPMAQTLYDCAYPATVGLPDPRPLLGIGGQALGDHDGDEGGDDPAPEAGETAVLAPFADLVGGRDGLGR